MKMIIGLCLGFCIGLSCGVFGLPLPAPPMLLGAALVISMTSGYMFVDKYLSRKSESS